VIYFGFAIYHKSFGTVRDEIEKNIPEVIRKSFGDWKVKYNKSYASKEEEDKRLEAYYENSKLVN